MREVIKGVAGLVIICFVSCFVSGCASNRQAKTPDELMSDQFTFSDVPIPSKFELLRKQSYAFKDGQARIALLRYKGKGKIDDISWFYQEKMSQFQWQEVNIIDYDKNMQQFSKQAENCLVTIEKINDPWFGIFPCRKILITVQLIPQKQNSSAGQGAVLNKPPAKEAPATYNSNDSEALPMPVLK
ncbi:hypothetical protein J7L67_04225 [bacterium]|nr:hypothetical protein [bacterium]